MTDIENLLERFRRGGELLATAITGAAGAELDFKPAPDQWSVRQIVSHLADSELVVGMRFRQIIAEDNPTLQWYDEKAWSEKLDWNRRKISAAVESMRRTRAESYELLKDLPVEAWSRAATHSRFGATTLGDQLKIYAEHVENHVVQLKSVRDAYRATKR